MLIWKRTVSAARRCLLILAATVLWATGWIAPAAAQLGGLTEFFLGPIANSSNEKITAGGTNYVLVQNTNTSNYTLVAWFPSSNRNVTLFDTIDLIDAPTVLTSPDGTLWVTASAQGQNFVTHIVANIDTQNPTAISISVPALKSGSIRTAEVDARGNLWVSAGDKSGNTSMIEVTASGQAFAPSAIRSAPFPVPVASPDDPVTCSTATGGTPFQIPTPQGAAYPPDALNLALGPDGNIWFTETPAYDSNGNQIVSGTEKIGCINANGIVSEYVVPTQNAGTGSSNTTVGNYIAAGADGNVWFTEYEAGKVAKITPSGVITEYSLNDGGFVLLGLALGGDGNVWVRGYGNQIWRVTPAGVVTPFTTPTTDFGSDVELVLGPDRALWYPEDEKIGRIDTDGSVVEFPLPTPTVNGSPNYSFQLVFNASGAGSLLEYYSSDVVRFKISLAGTHDFSGDGVSDILWRDTSGDVAVWLMSAGQESSGAMLGNAGGSWSVVGQRDFDGDGKADILWLDKNGDLGLWQMNGAGVSSSVGLGNVGTQWSVVGIGDFNGDGTGDILWRNANGNLAVWLMSNGQFSSGASLGQVSSDWSVAGIGDFNEDGASDILWRNTSSGDLAIWFMSNGQVSSAVGLANVPLAWSVVGVGDFNGDGTTDILWRDTAGDSAIWLINNGGFLSGATIASGVPATWSVAETGDFNGDGKSDILWIDTSTGDLGVWLMNGTTVGSANGLGNVGTAWTVQGQNAD